MIKVTLEEAARMYENIVKKGLKDAFKKDIARLNKMRRKGVITEKEFLTYYDTSLHTFGFSA